MMIYILKFSACLGILMLFYRFFLERENMHRFKRFYLLGAMLSALLIPLITFTEVVEVATVVQNTSLEVQEYPSFDGGVAKDAHTDTLPLALWGIYLVGALLFGWQFLRNLVIILKRIRYNPKYRTKNAIKVLLRQPIVPHTFFQYIFLNKQRYEAKEIPDAVLLHEEIHALQRHSLDVLFIELLQVVFWFNPLIYLAKSAIKLNHEFLADHGVLQKGISPSTYQNILLAYSSQALSPLPLTIGMANSLNYSSIKKRMSVMRTRTSKQSGIIRSLVLLPLLALLTFGFSEREVLQVPRDSLVDSKMNSTLASPGDEALQKVNELAVNFPEDIIISEDFHIQIDQKGQILVQNKLLPINDIQNFLESKNSDLSKDQRSQIHVGLFPHEEAPMGVVNDVKNILKTYGVRDIELGLMVETGKVADDNSASPEQMEAYDALARKWNLFLDYNMKIVPGEKKRSEQLYGLMSKTQRSAALPFPDFSQAKMEQDGATKDQIKEYNSIIKKINAQPENRRIYKKKEIERLEFIYGLMSELQKQKALPYPDFPPMPEPPAPRAPKKAMTPQAIRAPEQPVGIRLRTAPVAPEAPDAPEVPEIEEPVLVHVEEIGEVEAPEAPEPPESPEPPMSPLDHVIEMAKADATFYYDGKKISSDKAIEILKKNESVNIDINAKDGKPPVVKLSDEPFVFDN